jgi:hypothetical protein
MHFKTFRHYFFWCRINFFTCTDLYLVQLLLFPEQSVLVTLERPGLFAPLPMSWPLGRSILSHGVRSAIEGRRRADSPTVWLSISNLLKGLGSREILIDLPVIISTLLKLQVLFFKISQRLLYPAFYIGLLSLPNKASLCLLLNVYGFIRSRKPNAPIIYSSRFLVVPFRYTCSCIR